MVRKTGHAFGILVLFLVLMGSAALLGGTSGKIMGVITDLETKDPLIGANITIVDTKMGAAADVEGYFTIINVPPGVYNLKASMMGYQSQIVEKIRVSIDLTTSVNFQLVPIVLDMAETVSITAERPLVQMDMTSSLASVASDEIDALPVQTVADVLEMQAGIVRTGDELHIRGGRAGEIAFWVDGISTTEFYDGGMGINVENSSIQELQVVSGTFNAEYGQAMSGIINIITKEGGQAYSGEIKGYVGDYVSDQEQFYVLDNTAAALNPLTGNNEEIGVTSNPLDVFNPIYNVELSLSGPVPGLGDALSFFVNGRYFSDEGYLYGRNWYTPQANPGDSSIVPMNPYWRNSLQTKLAWRVTPDIKISYNGFFNNWKYDRTYNHSQRYSPYGIPQQSGNAVTHIFSLNHVLSDNTFYELKVNRFQNKFESYVYQDPRATVQYRVRVPGDEESGSETYSFDPNTPEGQAELDKLIEQRILFEYYPDPNGPAGYVDPSYDYVPAAYSFQNGGANREHQNRESSYWITRFDLISQLGRKNQIKAGLEARLHEIQMSNFTVLQKIDENDRPIYPFEPMVPEESSIYWDGMTRKPREFSAYLQDKLELNDLIINLGLRFDFFDANATIPTDPEDPNIYFPYKNENKYKNWQEPSPDLSPQELEDYLNRFEEYEPEERRAFMHQDVDPKMAINPRLGIAYPITDQGVIHFSYGHFFQVPNLTYLYQNPDYKLSAGGGYQIFGNPNLDPQRTAQYEIGLQQQLTTNSSIDFTIFYKDIRDLVQTSPLIDTPIPDVKYSMYENRDYANVRGLTLSFKKRHSNNFSVWLDYTFQVAEGTYSDPRDAYNAFSSKEEPRLSIIPLDWDQRHTLNARFIYQLGTWTASIAGRYWSGLPYTPTIVRGVAVGQGAEKGLRDNSARLPAQKSIDLLLQKQFMLKTLRLEVFMNIYNIFDSHDAITVHTDTGSAEYTTNPDPAKVPYSTLRIGTVDHYVTHPEWYIAPRQIHFGIAIGF